MKLKKKGLALLLSSAMVLSSLSVPTFAQEADNNAEVKRSYGGIPQAYEVPYEGTQEEIREKLAQQAVENAPYISSFALSKGLTTSILSYAAEEELPSSYNTSSSKQYVSSVKDQGDWGSCWAHAALAIYEGRLMIQNNSSESNMYDYSENHMRTALANENGNVYGYPDTLEKGGNAPMAISYLRFFKRCSY